MKFFRGLLVSVVSGVCAVTTLFSVGFATWYRTVEADPVTITGDLNVDNAISVVDGINVVATKSLNIGQYFYENNSANDQTTDTLVYTFTVDASIVANKAPSIIKNNIIKINLKLSTDAGSAVFSSDYIGDTGIAMTNGVTLDGVVGRATDFTSYTINLLIPTSVTSFSLTYTFKQALVQFAHSQIESVEEALASASSGDTVDTTTLLTDHFVLRVEGVAQ